VSHGTTLVRNGKVAHGSIVGALIVGLLADRFGRMWAIAVVGGLTLLSGVVVAALMPETLNEEWRKRS
jgi:hypothetical protein